MTSLVAAVEAVKDKIENSASGATPEELAYLGTAIDRIGGRATIYEVVEAGDIKKRELTVLGDNLKTGLDTLSKDTTNKVKSSLNTMIADYQKDAFAVRDSAISAITTTKDEVISKVESVKNAAVTTIKETKAAAETHVNTVKADVVKEINTAETRITNSKDKALEDISKATANVSKTVDAAASAIQNTFLQRSLFIASF